MEVRVQAAAVAAVLPPMAGRLVEAGEDLCFVPRYPFLAGTVPEGTGLEAAHATMRFLAQHESTLRKLLEKEPQPDLLAAG